MTDERAREIFTEAGKLPESERAAFLEVACGGHTELIMEVVTLLKKDGKRVEKGRSPQEFVASGYMTGDSIGPFKILSRLGEGGFGVVYLAEQTSPVKRRVALKVIKPGMDTKAVIVRFEAEQQALALMNHPGIAKVFDAGTTPEGRPYFVMEFVKGDPLTQYCDHEKLDTSQRLELFAKICDAVQHAHQKGIIHRDLKPGNILVSIDARNEPQPKVIDFGIAKAMNQQLSEQTIFTQQGQLIGTLEYMSPEQAEMRAVDIDTRTDVYSLGVILYELLTGTLPLDRETLREKGIVEIQRMIREDDPPKPSTKLTTLQDRDEGTRIAKARRTRLDSLASTLRKELEWIPLKAIRKTRQERYGSAEALGDDVRRYLAGEPLEAGPESARYRLMKLVRRNKGPFVAAVLVAVALVAGMIGTTIFAVKAQQQEAQANAVNVFVTEMLSSVDPKTAMAMDKELMTLILNGAAMRVGETLQDQPLVEAKLRGVIGKTYSSLSMYEEAKAHVSRALQLNREHLGDEHEDTLLLLMGMSSILTNQAKYDEAMPYYTEVWETTRRVMGEEHPVTLVNRGNLAMQYLMMSKPAEAEPHVQFLNEWIRDTRSIPDDADPNAFKWYHKMGVVLLQLDRSEEAEPYLRRVLEIRRRNLGDDHPDTILSLNNVIDSLISQRKYVEAQPLSTEVVERSRRILGDDHISTLCSLANYGNLFYMQGKYDEADRYWTEVHAGFRRKFGDEHPDTLWTIAAMGDVLYKQGKYDEALVYYAEVLETSRRVLGDEHPDTLKSIVAMGDFYEAWHEEEPEKGHDAKAAEYRALLEELSGTTPAEPAEAAAP